MAIFGEKCIRCGKRRTKHTHEGLPTCEACEEALITKARAESEGARCCVADGSEMKKDVILNVVIDRCPKCNGVWLDGGELELIRVAVGNGVAMDLARAMPFSTG
jgi:hypothetical protein